MNFHLMPISVQSSLSDKRQNLLICCF